MKTIAHTGLAALLAATLVGCQAPAPAPVVIVHTSDVPRASSPPPAKPRPKVASTVSPAPKPRGPVRSDLDGRTFEDTPPEQLEPVKSRPVVLDR